VPSHWRLQHHYRLRAERQLLKVAKRFAASYFAKVFTRSRHFRTAYERCKEPVKHLKVHGALVAAGCKERGEIPVLAVDERLIQLGHSASTPLLIRYLILCRHTEHATIHRMTFIGGVLFIIGIMGAARWIERKLNRIERLLEDIHDR
jgi:hypothetical protein